MFPVTPNTPAVTVFSSTQLDQIVKSTLPTGLPDGHKNAVVGTVDQNGAQVVASFALGNKGEWQLQAAAQHKWTGDNSVGARVILSW